MTTKTLCVAQYLLNKYNQNYNEPINGCKLVKLTYLAHGWSLAYGTCWLLKDESIIAGTYGPMIESIYDEIKFLGGNPINKISDISYLFKKQEMEVMNSTIKTYGKWTNEQLSLLCNQKDSPWADTIDGNKSNKNRISKNISNDLIMEWFRNQLEIYRQNIE